MTVDTNKKTGIKNAYYKIHLFYLTNILLSATVINYSFGYHGAKGIDIIFTSFTLMVLSLFTTTRIFILTPFFILMAIYFPVGYLYGKPSISIIASMLQTNHRESFEFIKSLPLECYSLPLIAIIDYILLRKYVWRINSTPFFKYSAVTSFLVIMVFLSSTGKLLKIKQVDFFITAVNSFKDYKTQTNELKNAVIDAKWSIVHLNKKPEIVLVIIGESMRTDYMSAFGYPLPTTPFLDAVNGTFYRNYVSTAPNTFLSLPRSLSLSSGKEINISYNVVNLSKQAGFETFWLSNQGLMGEFDTPTSKLAMYSDHIIFLKKGDFESKNTNDDSLLPYLKNIVSSRENNQKTIFMHIMGSHPQFEDRLNGTKPYFTSPEKDISNYISTYRKTHAFIKSTYNILKHTNKSFKIIYFSDHGLSERKIGDSLYLRHGQNKKQNYNVPLVILSSEDKSRVYNDSYKSAFNFISLFANELNIKVTSPTISVWDHINEDPEVFDGSTMVSYGKLGNEPAVVPN